MLRIVFESNTERVTDQNLTEAITKMLQPITKDVKRPYVIGLLHTTPIWREPFAIWHAVICTDDPNFEGARPGPEVVRERIEAIKQFKADPTNLRYQGWRVIIELMSPGDSPLNIEINPFLEILVWCPDAKKRGEIHEALKAQKEKVVSICFN